MTDKEKPDTPDMEHAGTDAGETPLAELNFATFILSLSTSVLVSLGELPEPITNEKKLSLPLAKQTISLIEMLQDKTKGNLTQDEEILINNILYDLRLKYISTAKLG